MESVIKMNKGYYRNGKTQRVFRSEFEKMLGGALYQYEFIKDSGVDYFLSANGLDFVYKQFTENPELGQIEVPATMFVLAKLQSNPKKMEAVLEEKANEQPIEEPKKNVVDALSPGLKDITKSVRIEPINPPFISQQRFNEIVEKRIETIRKSLISKGEEYASKDLTQDRMYNFKRGAEIAGTTPTTVLFGYALKHITSIIDIIKKIEKGIIPSEELVDEKLMDIINYMILLDVAIEDARNNEASN